MATLLHSLEITLQSLVPTVCQRPNNSEHQGNTGDRQCNTQVGIPTYSHSNLLHSLVLSGYDFNRPKGLDSFSGKGHHDAENNKTANRCPRNRQQPIGGVFRQGIWRRCVHQFRVAVFLVSRTTRE